MKVVYIADQYEYYGANESLMAMIVSLNKKFGVVPIVLTYKKGRISRFADENGFENYSIGHRPFLVATGGTPIRKVVKFLTIPFFFVRYKIGVFIAVKKAEKCVDFTKVDVIHTNLNRNDIGQILAKRNGIKHIYHLREFVGADYPCYSLRRKYVKFMNSNDGVYISVSNAVKNNWIRKGLGENRISVIYNGIDSEKFNSKKWKINRDSKIKMVMVGALISPKGHEFLIEEMALLPLFIREKIQVDIYGDGPKGYKQKLIKIVKRNNLEKCIRFCGYCEDINMKLRLYDVGLMCSNAEAFGRCTVEYMMSGLITIAADTGANMEIIDDGVTGFVFNRDKKGSLADKMYYVVENFSNLRNISFDARQKAIERFSLEKNTESIFDLYSNLCSR